jgi:glycosyltransferase involved in cell wall biosynthesis
MKLSVVMPAYNEEDGLAAAVAEVQRCVLDSVPDSELVVVDDGSRDGTPAILDALAARDPRIRAIHRANGGHGPAVTTARSLSMRSRRCGRRPPRPMACSAGASSETTRACVFG